MPTPQTFTNGRNEVKLYTTQGRRGASYQACYYVGGKRERKTFADLAAARRFARQKLNDLATTTDEAEAVSTPELESYLAAKRIIAPAGLPLHNVCETFMAAREMLGATPLLDAVRRYLRQNKGVQLVPIRQAVQEFLVERERIGVCWRYMAQLRCDLNRFTRAFAGRHLPDIGTPELDEWICSDASRAQITRTNVRQRLTTFAHWCRKRGYLSRECRTFEDMASYSVPPAPILIYTPEEMRKLMGAVHDWVGVFFAIWGFAGLRSEEIRRLDWRDVNLDRGFIVIEAEKAKTKRRRLVPISENLAAWLRPIARESGSVLGVFNTHMGSHQVCDRAGVAWKRNAFRHSYVSYRLALTNDAAKVALEAGHDAQVMFAHYRELVRPDQAQEWFNIFPEADYPQCLKARCKPRGQAAVKAKLAAAAAAAH
jgi:integrase